MSDLAEGMDSGIGPSGALDFDAIADQLPRDALEFSLDAAGVELRLPAGELRAIVFERDFESLHVGVRNSPRCPIIREPFDSRRAVRKTGGDGSASVFDFRSRILFGCLRFQRTGRLFRRLGARWLRRVP